MNPKTKKSGRNIRAEAQKIANSIKIEGQSKAEITAIANGIQRGMELFLRQQSEKTRDLDKRIKKAKQLPAQATPIAAATNLPLDPPSTRLPWILLVISWILFLGVAGYLALGFS
ncbi:MAG TPA: DUF2956 family protein [Cellvibrio sp.]|nr:DUF2956 family protein [Cellvibrio sp.]